MTGHFCDDARCESDAQFRRTAAQTPAMTNALSVDVCESRATNPPPTMAPPRPASERLEVFPPAALDCGQPLKRASTLIPAPSQRDRQPSNVSSSSVPAASRLSYCLPAASGGVGAAPEPGQTAIGELQFVQQQQQRRKFGVWAERMAGASSGTGAGDRRARSAGQLEADSAAGRLRAASSSSSSCVSCGASSASVATTVSSADSASSVVSSELSSSAASSDESAPRVIRAARDGRRSRRQPQGTQRRAERDDGQRMEQTADRLTLDDRLRLAERSASELFRKVELSPARQQRQQARILRPPSWGVAKTKSQSLESGGATSEQTNKTNFWGTSSGSCSDDDAAAAADGNSPKSITKATAGDEADDLSLFLRALDEQRRLGQRRRRASQSKNRNEREMNCRQSNNINNRPAAARRCDKVAASGGLGASPDEQQQQQQQKRKRRLRLALGASFWLKSGAANKLGRADLKSPVSGGSAPLEQAAANEPGGGATPTPKQAAKLASGAITLRSLVRGLSRRRSGSCEPASGSARPPIEDVDERRCRSQAQARAETNQAPAAARGSGAHGCARLLAVASEEAAGRQVRRRPQHKRPAGEQGDKSAAASVSEPSGGAPALLPARRLISSLAAFYSGSSSAEHTCSAPPADTPTAAPRQQQLQQLHRLAREPA